MLDVFGLSQITASESLKRSRQLERSEEEEEEQDKEQDQTEETKLWGLLEDIFGVEKFVLDLDSH